MSLSTLQTAAAVGRQFASNKAYNFETCTKKMQAENHSKSASLGEQRNHGLKYESDCVT
jgi:hypothetical protein